VTTLVTLAEPYRSIQAEARAAAAKLEPYAVEADNSATLDERVLEVLRDSALFEFLVPAEYGGRFETIDSFALCLIREAVMAVCSHADTLFTCQGVGSLGITVHGSEDQKAVWLPRVASGEVLAALALTEPVAGSDLKSIVTRVTGDGDALVLNGHKAFISDAGIADFYIVLAKDGSGEAMSAFLVPAGCPGLEIVPGPDLIAEHVIGELRFDNVKLSASARIGAPGDGLKIALSTLAVFRVSVAGASVGLAQVALEEATRHTRTREQFGRPLARLGPVAGHLADAWAEVAATRLLTYQVAQLVKEDPLGHLQHSSLAKLAATEAASRVIDRCVQVMGRWGLVKDSRVERCFRQARPGRIYEGASEVLRLGIARQLCDDVD
jgi:acyl-CoA dehydrogenase